MARARRHIATILAAVLAFWPGLPQPVSAMGYDDTARLRSGLAQLSDTLAGDPDARTRPLRDLFALYGLEAYTPMALPPARHREDRRVVPMHPATAELIDFRPVVALLSQGRRDGGDAEVIAAQGPGGPRALAFRGGLVTADHLRATLRRFAAETGGFDGTLRIPLIFWEDTVLRLGPDDGLALSREDGAFIVSLGQVEILGSDLGVTGGRNRHNRDFVPFLTVAGGGQLILSDATVRGLGFGYSDKYAGIAVLRHPFMAPLGPSRITGTRFEKVVSVVFDGTPDATIVNNRFHNMRDNAVRVGLAPGARILGNLFSGPAPTNAIRILDKSNGSVVAGNVLLEGSRVGIVVNGGSAYVTVRDNVLWRRNGGGIKFKDTSCGLASDNLILDNRQKGVEIYSSPGIRILGNRIEGNHSAAMWISGQPGASVTQIAGNVFRGNGTGLATATAARLWLDANDFTAQLPRLVGGDISVRNGAIVRDLRGEVPLLLSAAEQRADTTLPDGDCGPQAEAW